MKKEIEVTCILKTAPSKELLDKSLITLNIKTPYYVWVELLTHKRLSRNASSNRAMSTERNAELGYFIPTCHEEGKGMTASILADDDTQQKAEQIYFDVWEYCSSKMSELSAMGIHKGEASRVLPAFKMMNAVVTATYSAWMAFLDLRLNVLADPAMQDMAQKICRAIDTSGTAISNQHFPYLSKEEMFYPESEMIAAGRIARVSYGDVKSNSRDLSLAQSLLSNRHLSPFEHIAYWTDCPILGNLNSKSEDKFCGRGWESFRSQIEEGMR